jgi:hypothetical protein
MAGSLEFIDSTEVTSSTSAFSFDNIFSADYDVYQINLVGFSTVGTSHTAQYIRFINSSGSVISTTTYDYALYRMPSNTSFSQGRSETANFFTTGQMDKSSESSSTKMTIYNPYSSSSYTFAEGITSTSFAGNMNGYAFLGVEHTAQTIRGIQVLEPNVRPFDEGKIFVYGVK